MHVFWNTQHRRYKGCNLTNLLQISETPQLQQQCLYCWTQSLAMMMVFFLLQDILDNQAVSDPVFYTLVTLYSMMIIGSVLGNIMVITAVLKAPNMRKVGSINNMKIFIISTNVNCFEALLKYVVKDFNLLIKFVNFIISWLLFHLIWKNYVL